MILYVLNQFVYDLDYSYSHGMTWMRKQKLEPRGGGREGGGSALQSRASRNRGPKAPKRRKTRPKTLEIEDNGYTNIKKPSGKTKKHRISRSQRKRVENVVNSLFSGKPYKSNEKPSRTSENVAHQKAHKAL